MAVVDVWRGSRAGKNVARGQKAVLLNGKSGG